MKTTALVLCVLVPFTAFAQQKTELVPSPSYEQATPAPAVLGACHESVPLHKRWYVWAGAGAVVATIAIALAVGAATTSRNSGAVTRSDFSCGGAGMCDAWINPPAQ